MALLFMVFIWGANPVCFFIGGVLLHEFLYGIYHKDRRCVRNSMLTGAGVGVSFVTYYFYWLREVANSDFMQDFWKNNIFPLIPKSVGDIRKIRSLYNGIFNEFGSAKAFITLLVLAGFIMGIVVWKNRYVKVTALSLLVALFASYIHMFPVVNRLWCFSYSLFALIAFYAMDKLFASEVIRGGAQPMARTCRASAYGVACIV